MSVTDPVADALTKIRNASRAHHPTVEVRPSKFTQQVLDVLQQQGFIRTYRVVGEDVAQRTCRVYLKYAGKKTPAIAQVVRVSKPGVRVYASRATLPRVRRGMGVAIVTTSRGVMTERDAYRQGIGGEVVCYVW